MYVTVPDKTTGDIWTSTMWDTYVRDNLNTGCPVMVAISTLTGTAASVSFSSVPTTFSGLHLVGYARGDAASASGNANIRANSDSGSNYDYQWVAGSGATASANEGFAQTSLPIATIPMNTASANLFASFKCDIPGYASSANNKTFLSQAAHKSGTSSGNLMSVVWSGFWRSNNPITSLTIIPSSGNFVSGCRFVLYGVP